MKPAATFLAVCGCLFASLLLLPLMIGVWLPDAVFDTRRTLASATAPNGYRFAVVQYWNHIDFYSTELQVSTPDGRTEIYTLDGDDSKSWSVPLSIDEQVRAATVTLSGGRIRTVSWSDETFAEPVAPLEPPPRASVSDAPSDRTLDSQPAPGSSGGR